MRDVHEGLDGPWVSGGALPRYVHCPLKTGPFHPNKTGKWVLAAPPSLHSHAILTYVHRIREWDSVLFTQLLKQDLLLQGRQGEEEEGGGGGWRQSEHRSLVLMLTQFVGGTPTTGPRVNPPSTPQASSPQTQHI